MLLYKYTDIEAWHGTWNMVAKVQSEQDQHGGKTKRKSSGKANLYFCHVQMR